MKSTNHCLQEITNSIIGTEEQSSQFEYSRDNKIMISTGGENGTNLICELHSIDNQQRKNNTFKDFHNYKLITNESNILCGKINDNENINKSSNTINMGEEKNVCGCKELKNVTKGCNHEVMTYCTTSPALTGGSSGCSEVHHMQQDENCLNLEENISFGLSEETPSLQEMLETTNKHTKKQFVLEIPTFEVEMKQRKDLEQNEIELQNMHGQRFDYECSQRFIPSPLNLEESHGFQHDFEGQTIKEMLDIAFHSTSHEFVDKFVFGDGQGKGSLGYGSEGLPPKILQQDLQQVIIQQLDLEESHLFVESIEDHESKEMQESPIRSEGQDFLDEIMTCEGDNNEEIGTTVEQFNARGVCLEDLKLNENKNNSNIQSNMELIIKPNFQVCSTLNKHVDGLGEGKRYNLLSNIIFFNS